MENEKWLFSLLKIARETTDSVNDFCKTKPRLKQKLQPRCFPCDKKYFHPTHDSLSVERSHSRRSYPPKNMYSEKGNKTTTTTKLK